MNRPSIWSLVGPLTKATQSASVSWEDDPSGGYIATVGQNVVNIYRTGSGIAAEVHIRVLDDGGTVVDWGTAPVIAADGSELGQLYDLAQRQTRNVDGVLNDILHHLGDVAEPTH